MRAAWILVGLTGCHAFLHPDDDAVDTDDTPQPVSVGLAFEEVGAQAGVRFHGSSFGVAWGDVNQDGWPDLWSGNHAEGSSLYVNQRDGTFLDVSTTYLAEDRIYDAHGVSWLDLDNDGVSELLETVGGQQGLGIGANRVFRIEAGVFSNVAASTGLGYRGGSGRLPIAYDWNDDGRLDLLLVNQPRPDGQYPTALFTQQANGTYTLESKIPEASDHLTPVAGQLADLDGDRVMELVRYGRPTGLSAHDAHSGTLRDVSAELKLPPVNLPFDVVIADFDNDLHNDLYITRWTEASDVLLDEDGKGLKLSMRLFGVAEGVDFRTTGDVTVKLDPEWFWLPSEIKLGASCVASDSLEPTFVHGAADNEGLCPFTPAIDRGLYAGVTDGMWNLMLSSDGYDRGNLSIRSTASIDDLNLRISQLTEDEIVTTGRDRLWMYTGAGWEDQGWSRGVREPTTCTSAVAGDFDNDGDLDIFLVCATTVKNVPDVLLVNDGKGRFSVAKDFGAEGTDLGRGDSVAVADYDQDGFLDLFVNNGYAAPPFNDGPQQLFHNKGNANHWIELDLRGTRSNRDAIGTTVIVTTSAGAQLREVSGGTHYMAQNSARLHFGLGPVDVIEKIDVYWPDRTTQTIEGVTADQILAIVQE